MGYRLPTRKRTFVITRLRRMLGRAPRRWTIVTSAPKGERAEQWGDTWFARDLAAALNDLGQHAKVVSRAGANAEARDRDDVVVVLRGLSAVTPRPESPATWLLWIISHPEDVAPDEVHGYDAVFAASAHWSRASELGARTLLQATNPSRFVPGRVRDTGRPVFVGSTRGEFRPIVRDCRRAGIDVDVYGVGWEAFLPAEDIAGSFIANDELPQVYAAAPVVLNDHWADMAAEGFVSNRLFDAVASGARVLSDRAVGLDEVFGDAVRTYGDADELPDLLTGDLDAVFGSPERRRAAAERIAREHSFEARARHLIATVEDMGR